MPINSRLNKLSKLINSTPQKELVQDYGKITNIELQIADAIDNLENLSENPLGKRFNKGAVLRHLNAARVELNIASTLAGAPDTQTQILCFERIVKCRDYLNRAKDLIPTK